MTTSPCVVCGAPAIDEHYANAWERTRKRHPCCSAACAARFDPDVHWIPARLPEPAEDDEVGRLLRVGRQRLTAGDRPLLVVRELLVAGLPPVRVRGLLVELGSRAAHEEKAARRATLGSFVASAFGLLAGAVVFWRPRRTVAARLAVTSETDAAYAAIEEWRRATGAADEPAPTTLGSVVPAPASASASADTGALPRATARPRRDD